MRGKDSKALLKKGDKPYLALLAYWSTVLSNAYSPAEVLINRNLRTNVPSSRKARKPRFQIRSLWLKRRRSRDGNKNRSTSQGSGPTV